MTSPRLADLDSVRAAPAIVVGGITGWLAAVWLVTAVSYRFIAVITGVGLIQALVLARVFRRERRGPDLQPFTVATAVTVLRGGALAVLAGFLVVTPAGPAVWIPAALYAAAAGLDAVDGVVARRTDGVTPAGASLDTEIDALGLLIGAALAVAIGAAPVAYLMVGLARYGFVAGVEWRRWRGRPARPLPPSRARRVNAGAQMLVVVLLLSPVPGVTVSRVLAAVAMVPFLAVFVRDWLLVTGRLADPRV